MIPAIHALKTTNTKFHLRILGFFTPAEKASKKQTCSSPFPYSI